MKRPRFQIISDGQTVWVNNEQLPGRFGRYGVDVHRDGVCISCFRTEAKSYTAAPAQTGPKEWDRFVELMAREHKINVPEKYRPARCKVLS